METKHLNLRYTLLHCSYWGIFCALGGYVAVYLDGKGFTAGQAGTLLALTNILAAILQPFAAARADQSGRLSLRGLMLSIGSLSLVSLILLCFTGQHFWIVALLFLIAFCTTQLLQPLINSVGMYHLNQGDPINFGLARGLGSVAYAGVSYLLGTMILRVGTVSVPGVSAVLYLVFLGMAVTFHIVSTKKNTDLKTDPETKAAKEERIPASSTFSGIGSFFSRYQYFAIFLAGVIFMFTFHFMTNTYMFQMITNVGGNSQHMGIAVSIAAVCEIPVMLLFTRLVKRIPVEKLLRITAVCWTVKAVAFCFCTSVTSIYIVQVLQMFSFGLYVPASVYYANQIMDAGNKVKGQAMVTVAFTIGSVLGNLLGGKLIDWYQVPAMLIAGVVFSALGTVFFFLGTGKRR
ncbi:MAG: MFS transporter [Lachnospiraceae bacterium]|nr:MFS transporter [Lachnospiraceae bacterium]